MDLLPFLSIRLPDIHVLDSPLIETAGIDAKAVWMRPRNIERFDTAHRTKEVFGSVRVEAIRAQGFLTAQEPEAIARHNEMQIACFTADGAIAFGYFNAGRRDDFESHGSAVTSARVSNHVLTLENANVAVQRPRAALSSVARVHNEMTYMRRARDAVSRSAATACSAIAMQLGSN
ncbi:MAG TPA: hypothetical protein VIT67_00505 [Povalibacter sp.]